MFDLQKFATPDFGFLSAEDKAKIDRPALMSAVQNEAEIAFFDSTDTTDEPVCTIVEPDDFELANVQINCKPVFFSSAIIQPSIHSNVFGSAVRTTLNSVPADGIITLSPYAVTNITIVANNQTIANNIGFSKLQKEPQTVYSFAGGKDGYQYVARSSDYRNNYIFYDSETYSVVEQPSGKYNSYKGTNAGAAKAYMDFGSDTFVYGFWADYPFIVNARPCMVKYDGTVDYYLDPNDYTKKLDGTPSDVSNVNYPGNAMVEIPNCVNYVVSNNVSYSSCYGCILSNAHIPNFYSDRDTSKYCIGNPPGAFVGCRADANYNIGYEIHPYFYHALFEASLINGKLRSIMGQTPAANITFDQQNTYAKANGLGWHVGNWYEREHILFLTQFICANNNLSKAIGKGCATINKTGTTYNKGMFYGTSDGSQPVKVFHIENFWGGLGKRTGWLRWRYQSYGSFWKKVEWQYIPEKSDSLGVKRSIVTVVGGAGSTTGLPSYLNQNGYVSHIYTGDIYPKYISTVQNSNFDASVLIPGNAVADADYIPVFGRLTNYGGKLDALDVDVSNLGSVSSALIGCYVNFIPTKYNFYYYD